MVVIDSKISNLERIMELGISRQNDASQMLISLKSYFDINAGSTEELTKEQYFRIRKNLLSKYQSKINEAIQNNEISREESKGIAHTFTHFLRYQHYRLLEKEGKLKKPRTILGEETPVFLPFKSTWEVEDKTAYDLERAVFMNEDRNSEYSLIENLNPENLDKYQLKTLKMMNNRTNYQTELKLIVLEAERNLKNSRGKVNIQYTSSDEDSNVKVVIKKPSFWQKARSLFKRN